MPAMRLVTLRTSAFASPGRKIEPRVKEYFDMSRLTARSSTIFIATGAETRVYRSVEDVPPALRRKLVESTRGLNSATILIADKRGREELVRALQGRASVSSVGWPIQSALGSSKTNRRSSAASAFVLSGFGWNCSFQPLRSFTLGSLSLVTRILTH